MANQNQMNEMAQGFFDRKAEGIFTAFARAFRRAGNYFQRHPVRSTAMCVAAVGSIWYYEVHIVHGNRVYAPAHGQEFELTLSQAERDARASARQRVKAVKVPSAAEMAAAVEGKDGVSVQQRVEDLERRQRLMKTEGAKDPEEDRTDLATMHVTNGHLQAKEGTWALRNMERNWSIIAQDQFKQKDDYHYRMERSKDDDYGRLAAKRA
jgi:hypothetical protein